MRRREFIRLLGAAASAWSFSTQAQRADEPRRIAWLGLGRADEPSPYVDSLRASLRELGWTEGRNLRLDLFWATGRDDMEASGRPLLASDPEVIVTQELMVYAMRRSKRKSRSYSGSVVIPKRGSWCKAGHAQAGISLG
jgi:putative ABC transport system substrate-binding protein